MSKFAWIKSILPAALLLIFGCTSLNTPTPEPATPTSTATFTPQATFTVTPTIPPTLTPSPTSAPISNVPTDTPTPALIQQGDTLPIPTTLPTDTPTPGLSCTINAGVLNVREGPGLGYRVITTLPAGAPVSAVKCIPGGGWLLVETTGGKIGWVNANYVSCEGKLDTLPLAAGIAPPPALPPATPTPIFTPPAQVQAPASPSGPSAPINQWLGEYYNNPSLQGQPVLVRVDPKLEFNWILDSPAPEIPSDNFSVRWTGTFDFPEGGDYRFFADADDGIRMYVDGRLIIDAWNTETPVDHVGNYPDLQVGLHTITVEYFESGGYARIKVWTKQETIIDEDWYGEYFANSNLEGSPVFTRIEDDDIDFDWGNDSPDSRLSTNNFSIRWERTVQLDYGDYTFYAEVEDEDAVKVTVDGWTVIDEVAKRSTTLTGAFARLGGDGHTIVVEFREIDDKAKIKFWWERE